MKELLDDTAYIALHYHWSPESIKGLSRNERREYCKRISQHNEQLAEQMKGR